MKVSELIEKLQQCNPNAYVVKPTQQESWWYSPILTIKNAQGDLLPGSIEPLNLIILD